MHEVWEAPTIEDHDTAAGLPPRDEIAAFHLTGKRHWLAG